MFLEKIENFRGTGEKNEKGQTLEEFLEAYDAKKYDCPCNTVDMLIFRKGQPVKLLMIRRKNHPSIGDWALPGGFVELRENLYDAAKRELLEETGVKDVPMVQLKTWGDWDRDPRWRVITTAYLAWIGREIPVRAGDDAADALWFDAELFQDEKEGEGQLVLELKNKERKIDLSAVAQIEGDGKGRELSEPQYRILQKQGIASDHCLIITDAMLYLKRHAMDIDGDSDRVL